MYSFLWRYRLKKQLFYKSKSKFCRNCKNKIDNAINYVYNIFIKERRLCWDVTYN